MRKFVLTFVVLLLLAMACSTSFTGPTPTAEAPTASATTLPGLTLTPFAPASTPTLELSATPDISPTPEPPYPPEGYGPTDFPDNIDPLTGLSVADPALLDRRPIIIKVSNLPRNNRPR